MPINRSTRKDYLMSLLSSLTRTTSTQAAGRYAVTIRRATPADAAALKRLAALDSAPVPAGELLVAEVGGELWAAAAIDGPAVVADPFRPSGELALLLAQRAAQLAPGRPRRTRHAFGGASHRR